MADKALAGINIARRNISNLRYADDTTLMEEREELKSFLMKVKEEHEKVVLKLNIQKTKIMASSPITSWRVYGKTVRDFIYLFIYLFVGGRWAPKSLQMISTAMKFKDVAPRKKSYDQLRQYVKKQRHYFANKSPSSQSYGFSSSDVWM